MRNIARLLAVTPLLMICHPAVAQVPSDPKVAEDVQDSRLSCIIVIDPDTGGRYLDCVELPDPHPELPQV